MQTWNGEMKEFNKTKLPDWLSYKFYIFPLPMQDSTNAIIPNVMPERADRIAIKSIASDF